MIVGSGTLLIEMALALFRGTGHSFLFHRGCDDAVKKSKKYSKQTLAVDPATLAGWMSQDG